MHLGKNTDSPAASARGRRPAVGRAVIAPLDGSLERRARLRELEAVGERGDDGAPGAVAW